MTGEELDDAADVGIAHDRRECRQRDGIVRERDPSVVVGLMVLGGVQLIMIGIMGEYIGKILSELKARPVYFVAEHELKSAEGTDRTAAEPSSRSAAE